MNGPMKDVTVYPDQARGFARLAWKKPQNYQTEIWSTAKWKLKGFRWSDLHMGTVSWLQCEEWMGRRQNGQKKAS